MNKVESFSDRLKEAMKIRQVRQVDLCNGLGFKKSTFNGYVKSGHEPNGFIINRIATYLNVDTAWLMGCDVPMERETDEHYQLREKIKQLLLDGTDEQLQKILTYCKDIGLK